MAAILRLARAGLAAGNRVTAVATALVAALATMGVVAGLSVRTQGGPLVDRLHRDAGRPELVVYGAPDALARIRADAGFAAASPVLAYVDAVVALGAEPVGARITALPGEPAGADAAPVGRPLLRAGRWPRPGAPDEVVFDQAAAARTGLRPDDRVRLTVAGRPATLTVVGTALDLTDCFYPDCDPIRLFVDPAALPGLAPDPADRSALLVARLADPDAAEPLAARLTGQDGVTATQTWADTRDDLLIRERIFGAALAAFGGFVLLAATFVVAGAATVRLLARRREIALLCSVGYTGRQIVAGLVTETLLLGLAGVLVGWVAGSLLAPYLQVGLGPAVGRPGVRLDPLSLVGAGLLVGVALAAATALPARRAAGTPAAAVLRDVPPLAGSARVARVLDRLRLGPAHRYGLGALCARPARAALTAVTLAVGVAAVVVAAGFTATIDRLLAEPARIGQPYDAVVVPTGADPDTLLAALADTPQVAGWYSQIDRRGTLGDETFLSRAIGGDPARAGFVIREGRPLRAPGEAVVGYGLLRRFGLRVGDTVRIRAGDTPLTLRIVGWYRETEDTGEVLLYRAEMLPGVAPDAYLVSARPGDSAPALAAALRDRLGAGAAVRVRTAGPEELDTVLASTRVMAGLVLLVSLANLVATLLAGAREHARALGVLRTVGFTVGQCVAQAAAGGAALGLAAGIVGLPLGLLALRLLADQATIGMGTGPGLVEAPAAALLLATVPVAVLVGAAAGAMTSRRLAAGPAAELVRWE